MSKISTARGITLIETLVIFAIIFIFIVIIGVAVSGFNLSTSEGEHSGYVTAVETHGVIFKTVSVYFKTDPQSSQEDRYCVISSDLVAQLKNVQEKRNRVTVVFSNGHWVPPWDCKGDDGSIIRSIK